MGFLAAAGLRKGGDTVFSSMQGNRILIVCDRTGSAALVRKPGNSVKVTPCV